MYNVAYLCTKFKFRVKRDVENWLFRKARYQTAKKHEFILNCNKELLDQVVVLFRRTY